MVKEQIVKNAYPALVLVLLSSLPLVESIARPGVSDEPLPEAFRACDGKAEKDGCYFSTIVDESITAGRCSVLTTEGKPLVCLPGGENRTSMVLNKYP